MPDSDANQELIAALRRVHPRIAKRFSDYNDMDDILDEDLTGRTHEVNAMKATTVPTDDGSGVRTSWAQGKITEHDRIPRGTMEPHSEYAKRVGMTPFFPEVPHIIEARRGAMFATEPSVTVAEGLEEILKTIGPMQQRYVDLLDTISTRSYAYGLMAALVDFQPAPDDIREKLADGEQVSEQEAKDRNLNQPVIGLFNEREVLDYEHDAKDGQLLFVKLVEKRIDRTEGWQSEGVPVERYRIVDRDNITVFEIRQDEDKKETAEQIGEPIPHNTMNAADKPEVPVVLIIPNPGRDGFGDLPLKGPVAAEFAAARLGSDEAWSLYLHGNPVLVFKTDEIKDGGLARMSQIALGATKYVPIKAGSEAAGTPDEDLRYLALDTAGLDMIVLGKDKFEKRVLELAQKTKPNATTEPVAMSGTAKAWDFKTGEQQALFEHIGAIKKASDELLKMLTRVASDADLIQGERQDLQDKVNTSFEPSQDLTDPDMNVTIHSDIADVAVKEKLPVLQGAAIVRVYNSIKDPTDEEREAFKKEQEEYRKRLIEAAEAKEPEPEESEEDEGEEGVPMTPEEMEAAAEAAALQETEAEAGARRFAT